MGNQKHHNFTSLRHRSSPTRTLAPSWLHHREKTVQTKKSSNVHRGGRISTFSQNHPPQVYVALSDFFLQLLEPIYSSRCRHTSKHCSISNCRHRSCTSLSVPAMNMNHMFLTPASTRRGHHHVVRM